MASKITVVVSQGRSANPAKRGLEENIVAALLMDPQVDVTVIPHLYDLTADSTGMLCLQGISGDFVVASWLYPRAARWVMDRNGIKGQQGVSLLKSEGEDDEPFDEDDEAAEDDDEPREAGVGPRDVPNRKIYCLDLRSHGAADVYLDEIRRIAAETRVDTVELTGWIGGSPKPEQMDRFLNPAPGNVASSDSQPSFAAGNGAGKAATQPLASSGNGEAPARRWYPVIDYSRCTNCLECIDFCLFGVYGIDQVETILVEQPDNCRKGCPACSRVCPANAIIFPEHKTPAIAGSPVADGGSFKIDLSKLFGAPDADPMELAVRERDVELVRDGRDAVGMSVGIPKRQTDRDEPKDELDNLIDELDSLEL